MNILFFARRFWPMEGGVERHVLEVGKRLVEKGHKVTVVAEKISPPRSPFGHLGGAASTIDGIDIVRHDFGGEDWYKKFRIWKWLWQHKDLIKNADIVHAHDVFFWYLPFRFLYPTKSVFTTFHGYETRFPPTKKAILWRKLSEKLSWGNICVGDYIRKWYYTTPTFVTYGGVDVHLGGAMASHVQPVSTPVGQANSFVRSIRGEDQKLKIILVGRLERDIGVQLYLETLEVLRKRHVPFTFEAYGEGLLRKQVEQYGKVHGFTNRLREVIEKADIVFASSYLSIMQAMAAKRIVFAVYDNPLKEDYLKMAPFAKFISIVDSADAIVDQVQNLGKTKEKVDKAYTWAKAQTWEKVVDLYLNLWGVDKVSS